MTRYWLLLPAALLMPTAQAHYIPSRDTPTTVDVAAVATWRSSSLIDNYTYWQIPGTMMGGHAWHAEKGVEVDEALISLAHRIDDNFFGVLEFGSHSGGGDDHGGVALEHAYIGWACCQNNGPWVVEVGQMSARFSPGIGQHAADRLTSETPLALDVFFGRHFHDQGARLWWHETGGFSVGAEIWRGKAFPATRTSDGGAWDIFGRYAWQGERLSVEAGGWFYAAKAEARADHRYGGGHQHVPVAPPGQTATIFPDTRFTGDTGITGVHARLSYQLTADWRLGMDVEWMRAEMDGVVHDAVGRRAHWDGTQDAGWIQPTVTWRRHTFGVRAERLSTENHLTGPAAPQLADDAGLTNPGNHEPRRFTAVWRWQWRDNIALRAEAVRDESLPASDQRWTLGVIWQQRLWPASSPRPAQHHH